MITIPRLAAPTTRHCPACDADTPHRTLYRKWGYPILSCRGCGLGRTDAAGFDPGTYYTADYFTGKHRDGYGDYTGSADVLRAEFAAIAKHLKTLAPGRRLLEVGSAYGYFLDAAQQTGFQAKGIEICDDAVASCKARGLDATAGVVTKLKEAFDAIVLLDVIEHLPDPAETIGHLSDALAPGGVITFTTGNWSSLLSTLAGSRWRLMTPPQHLFFYSTRTLPKLLANHGLQTREVRRPWKRVPLGLMAYQLTRRLGVNAKLPEWLSRIGVPMNLFDAMRVTAIKTPQPSRVGRGRVMNLQPLPDPPPTPPLKGGE